MTALQAKSASSDDHLRELDARFQKQHGQLEELDLRMSKHFNAVEAQIQDLQKGMSSPKTSPPTSPGHAAKTFDVVMGGRQAGESREWIVEEVAKLLERAGVKEFVYEAKPLGNRRPKCLKLFLIHPNQDDVSARRDQQATVIRKLQECQWGPRGASKPAWVKPDRTLLERNIAKAYAILYQFVEGALQEDKAKVEVEAWVNLEVWCGNQRVMGNAIGASACSPPRGDEYIVWVVQEHQHGLSVWLDLKGLALGLSAAPPDVLTKWKGR